MSTWICLLRGVNLGARNRLAMADLRDALADIGLVGARTYLQSGNVIVDVDEPERLATRVRTVIHERFGLDVPVIVRSPEWLTELLDWCPFRDVAEGRPATVHFLHLATRPEPEQLERLTAQDWSPDELAVHDRGLDVVVTYATSMHASRLQHTAILRRLGVDGTARNWRTVQALTRLACGH